MVPPSADLELTKGIAPATPTAGVVNGATYTVTVQDLGPRHRDQRRVVDPLPPEFTPSSVTAPGFTCNLPGPGGTLVCTCPSLTVAAGPQTITITGTFAGAASAGSSSTRRRVDSSDADPIRTTTPTLIDTLVIPAADLSISKFASTPTAAPGDTSHSPSRSSTTVPARRPVSTITDTLPSGLAFVSASPGCSDAGGHVTCSVGSLAPAPRSASRSP